MTDESLKPNYCASMERFHPTEVVFAHIATGSFQFLSDSAILYRAKSGDKFYNVERRETEIAIWNFCNN